VGASQVELNASLAQHPSYDRASGAALQKGAVEAWWQPGHPGWAIWPADSEQFMRGVVEAGDPALSPIQIIAPLPATPHSGRSEAPPFSPFQGWYWHQPLAAVIPLAPCPSVCA